MPVYEYTCPDCGHRFEELVSSVAARDQVECPKCGGKKPTRQMSVFAAREGGSASAPVGGACSRCGDAGGSCPLGG